MIVPIWLIVTAAGVMMLLLIQTILMFFAWKGMELMNREFQARLKIVQLDVSGLFSTRYQPGHRRPEDAQIEDKGPWR